MTPKIKITLKKTPKITDSELLHMRESYYNRFICFKKHIKKHALSYCQCHIKGKVCNYDIGILKQIKDAYLKDDCHGDKMVEDNIELFETIYNTSMSITQSLRSKAGSDFEHIIECGLSRLKVEKNIHYKRECYIDIVNKRFVYNNSCSDDIHRVDFVFPPPSDKQSIYEFNGIILSAKTTTRERRLQDKYIPSDKLFLITIDNTAKGDNVICIAEGKNNFMNFVIRHILPLK